MRTIQVLLAVAAAYLMLSCSGSGGGDVTGSGSKELSISDGTATEGDSVRFIVTLSGRAAANVTFSYSTVSVSAQDGSDYDATSGRNTISVGSTADTLTVATIDDAEIESPENFNIKLTSVVNATISRGTGIGSILDNDGGTVSVLYSSDIRPILLNRCAIAGCHGTGSSSGGYTMGNATYSEVRTAAGDHGAIISAGDAATSNLYLKTTANPPFLGRMPLNRTPLSTADQEKIRNWINEGAVDN
jgi:hypothetical protein